MIFPASITINKDAVRNHAQDFAYSATGGLIPSTFTLDDDGDGTLANTQLYPGNHHLRHVHDHPRCRFRLGPELQQPGLYRDLANSGTQSGNVGTRTVTINLEEGENVTCTFINTLQTGTLTVIKHVVNDNGGTATAGSWSLHVKLGPNEVTGSPQAGAKSPGTSYTLAGGDYTVSETGGPSGYTFSGFSGDCDFERCCHRGRRSKQDLYSDQQRQCAGSPPAQDGHQRQRRDGAIITAWTLTATGPARRRPTCRARPRSTAVRPQGRHLHPR